MDRRDFIKSGLLAAAVGAVGGPKVIAQEAERQVAREEMSKDILNYNPQMQYRPMGRTGVNVSALGFGMLRLPMKNGHVDFDQTTPMVRRAIEGGVNYIDTGRVYLGGESEQAVGKALAGGWRDRVYVTSKMPWWEMRSADDFEKFFDQSRRAIGTDVIDFYHIHMIMHRAWKNYVLPYKLIEKMERLKAQGKIRFMGFSFHDSLQLFKRVVEYTPAWDFCLIQHNYLDYEYEAGVLGPKYAAANGMGLAVMKPVRTGFLANLPQTMRDALASTGIRKPDTEWALNYLWDIPEVSVAVSGMGSMADVEENLKYAAKARPNMLTPAERERWELPSMPTATRRDTSTARAATSASPARTMSQSATSSPMCTTTTSCTKTKKGQWRTIPSRCLPYSVATRHPRALPVVNAWRSARSIWIFRICWRG